MGPTFPEKITALTCSDDFTFVASGSQIYVVERNVIISKIDLKKENLTSMAILGEVLVASGQSSIYLFDLKTYGKSMLILLKLNF